MSHHEALHGAFYVTGPSAAGKSTLAATLTRLGYNTHDLDRAHNGEPSIGEFMNDDGTPVPPDKARPEDENWAKCHRWTINDDRLRTTIEQFKDSHLFICGATRNQYDYFDLFKKIFYLNVRADTILDRLEHERDHAYGKHAFQRQIILDDLDDFQTVMRTKGAIFIEADQTIKKVAENIIREASA